MAKFLEKSPFFNLNDSSLGRHVKCCVTQKLTNSSVPNTKPRTLLKRKFV